MRINLIVNGLNTVAAFDQNGDYAMLTLKASPKVFLPTSPNIRVEDTLWRVTGSTPSSYVKGYVNVTLERVYE